MGGCGRARGVILIGCGPLSGWSRGKVLIGRWPVGGGEVLGLLRAAVAMSGRVAAGNGRGREQGGRGDGGGGERAVERGGRRGHERAGLETPQELLVVAAQPLLLGALLLHRLVEISVLLRQLPAGGGGGKFRHRTFRLPLRTRVGHASYLERERLIWIWASRSSFCCCRTWTRSSRNTFFWACSRVKTQPQRNV